MILQFHRADQYFSLNENLLPSEMQTKLCCFILLSTQRPHSLPVSWYTSLASRAGNVTPGNWRSSTLCEHVCLLPLGTPGSLLSQKALFEHALLSSRLTDITSSHLPLLADFLPFPWLLLSRHSLHNGLASTHWSYRPAAPNETVGKIKPGPQDRNRAVVPTLTAVSVFLEGASAPTSSPDFQGTHKNSIPAFSLLLSLLCALGSFYKTNEHELQGMRSVNHCKLSRPPNATNTA